MGLKGTISHEFSALKSLQRLVLTDNNLTATIPEELMTLRALTELDVSNNQLYVKKLKQNDETENVQQVAQALLLLR
ncbi:hypothetical protein RJ639_038462 [Escallonia herrerae]|uniref:Uncharacterized protein n=1 Tax=Escallonia herrerae TaxID=1293975 RepID=A0AA88WLG5_9ASTE|nr:hypothetical protein RJ639_038462 [Escallonia herrerae]